MGAKAGKKKGSRKICRAKKKKNEAEKFVANATKIIGFASFFSAPLFVSLLRCRKLQPFLA